MVKLYMKFLTAGEVSISEIGILTPYLAQRNLLKKAMLIAREVEETVRFLPLEIP